METTSNKYVAVSYQLYDISNDTPELLEQTQEGHPFDFISGLGIALESFERNITDLAEGADFDFTLTPEQAYGTHEASRVLDLDKKFFDVDGQFDAEHVKVGAVIPLQNEDGNRFNGLVKAITDTHVQVDLNHPLAGKTLSFKGHVDVLRDATNEEIAAYVNKLQGGCSGGCKGKGHKDGCCGHHHHEGEECCGHHHHEGEECCGHHHHEGEECCGHHHEGGCQCQNKD